jgi:solute carrier family 39 (zinc transporter), member 1/2/3
MPDDLNCGSGNDFNGKTKLRIGGIFVILITSMAGVMFPIVARRVKSLRIPQAIYDFAKYFGSGVIIATAFIHVNQTFCY